MITFDKEGLHFDVDLTPEDFQALEAYVTAIRVDERVRLIQFLDSTLPKAQPTEETPAEDATVEAPAEETADVTEPTSN
jgi:hypothetical protein